jgi:hypothetical protein
MGNKNAICADLFTRSHGGVARMIFSLTLVIKTSLLYYVITTVGHSALVEEFDLLLKKPNLRRMR